MDITDGLYTPIEKPLHKLFDQGVPRTLKDLQKLLGSLNYLRRFIPMYARIVQPIQDLVAAGSAQWTAECSRARNQLCAVLSQRLPLAIPDPSQCFFLYLDAGPEGMGAVLAQPR